MIFMVSVLDSNLVLVSARNRESLRYAYIFYYVYVGA
jgi:hypothetical protein